MNKNRQHILVRWLRSQSQRVNRWLRLSMLLGLLSTLIIVAQAWALAALLQALIMENIPRASLTGHFVVLAALFALRAAVNYVRERVGFIAGSVLRRQIRAQVLDRLERLGPAWIRGKPAGSWSSMLLEQIEDMHDYYARYLPQMTLSVLVPLMILIVVFPLNWAAGLILFLTAPLIPLFIALVGMGAADANRRNFLALARLSGYFLDRLRGLETLRLFFRAEAEAEDIRRATEAFRQRTMEVLRLAFLSSGILEFFASISIAVAAVYFGFSYLGELHFGSYGTGVTLFAGFLVLILAPEFFQPLRDLGTFYHAKAQAVGAAESLVSFLEHDDASQGAGQETPAAGPVSLLARDLWVLAPDGSELAGPLNFSLVAGQRVAIVGASGAGKSSLLGVLLGFLPYRGSLQVNGLELRALSPRLWRERLSWVSQSPALPAATLRDNVLLGAPAATASQLAQALEEAYVAEFLAGLPDGLDSAVGEDAGLLSVGQAQRVALARALIRAPGLLLLDEPTASLDVHSERLVMRTLDSATRRQTTLLVTHQLQAIADYDAVWVMAGGIIAQQGRYADLTACDGPLADLIASRAQEL
ncbi:cysteine/glutathione ABC transporter membrane/ATP-binding component [Candidatus Sodalis pierantonius str. SOPE]|uniref:Cysteine/glutathione ABC transporter membrane/ATP-binding component n=1 Tax=Candidatus Sodalis pierantonii str. SOPE TaxID=2342 RepID=W0HNA2_9GAMM|nr:cysteine/glutathione ABC transporter permease/ATP-binding protein CydD [Candidatus Sodalis pierantonius]AHF73957.1 cysteine/glutathione ABC transporter membrane/ATP-binding component [Candidatus Sodalis pierantonius str. SOPE]